MSKTPESSLTQQRDEYGMQTMGQHLLQLCREELITLDEARRVSRSKDLERKLMFSYDTGDDPSIN